jgi:putative DNA primase/helicase
MSLDDRLDKAIGSGQSGNQTGAKPEKALVVAGIADPRRQMLNKLIDSIDAVDLDALCQSLGWYAKNEGQKPSGKHYKVAIAYKLLEIARANNWHLIHDGFFYIYSGSHWLAYEDKEIRQLAKMAAIKMGYPVIESSDARFVAQLGEQLITDGFFAKASRNTTESIINLRNGSLVIDGNGISLKPFDHCDFLTYQLDFDYDPKATNKAFLGYLDQVLPDKDTQKTLQQVVGYLFVKGLKMEKVFFLFGDGANGKSVFFEVFTGVVGHENVTNYSIESLTDDNKYDRAKIKDVIVNYGTDVKLNTINPANFKTMASGEPIQARLPYGQPFIMRDYAKLIFNINRMESGNIEHTHGFWRRILVIPFTQTIADDNQDKDLHTTILQNKAGVLNWIIEGAKAAITNRDIFVSDECRKFKERFRRETDSVAMFEDHIKEKLNGSIYYETVTDAYSQYKAFCLDAGHRHPLGRNTFSNRMVSLGFEKSTKEAGTYLEKHYFVKKV